jgi:hypothetical protein
MTAAALAGASGHMSVAGAQLLIGASDQALKWTQFAIEGRRSDAREDFPSVDAVPKLDDINKGLERLNDPLVKLWEADAENEGRGPRPVPQVARGLKKIGSDRLVLGIRPSPSKKNKLQLRLDWDYVTIEIENPVSGNVTEFGRYISGLRLNAKYLHVPSKGVRFEVDGKGCFARIENERSEVHVKLALKASNARSTRVFLRDFSYTITPNLDAEGGGRVRSEFGGGEEVEAKTLANAPVDYPRFDDDATKAMVRQGNIGILHGAEENVEYKVFAYVDFTHRNSDKYKTDPEYPVVIGDHSRHVRTYYENSDKDKRGKIKVGTFRYKSSTAMHPYGQWLVDLDGFDGEHVERARAEILAIKRAMDSRKHIEINT